MIYRDIVISIFPPALIQFSSTLLPLYQHKGYSTTQLYQANSVVQDNRQRQSIKDMCNVL